MKSHWIKPNGDREEHDTPEEPDWEEMRKFVGGDLELVSVMFKGRACHMLVHAMGAILSLDVNKEATSIYHEGVVKPGCERRGIPYRAQDYPQIHGPAVVLEGLLQ